MSIDFEKIKRLVALVEQNHLSELSVEEDGFNITVKAETSVEPIVSVSPTGDMYLEVQTGIPAMAQEEEVTLVEAGVSNAHLVEITSPMVGVFYRCPSPDSPSFVEVGDVVEIGQTLGLIEAMKVFSDVPAEVAGRIVAMPVGNGVLVQQGDVLAVVDTSSAAGQQ